MFALSCTATGLQPVLLPPPTCTVEACRAVRASPVRLPAIVRVDALVRVPLATSLPTLTVDGALTLTVEASATPRFMGTFESTFTVDAPVTQLSSWSTVPLRNRAATVLAL